MTQSARAAEGARTPDPRVGPLVLRAFPARHPALLFVAPASLALLSCLWGISERRAWRDEHATWWAASLSFEDLYRLTQHVDLVLGPYFAFMHLWVAAFGDSVVALRLPSALAMAVASGLVGLLGRRMLGGRRRGLVAGLLFALVPTVARYGQEARPYAFAMVAVLMSFLALLRAVERPTTRRWALYGLTILLVGWAHLVALSVLVAHLGAVLPDGRHGRRRVLRAWSTAAGGGLALVAPLAVLARAQAQQIAWNTPAWNDIAAMPYMLFRSPAMACVVLGGAAVVLAAAGRCRRYGSGQTPLLGLRTRGPGPHLTPLALWALAPFLLTLATVRWLHLFLDRYLLFTVPAWVLLATLGMHRIAGRVAGRRAVARGTVAAVVAVIAASIPVSRSAITHNGPREPDYHSVAVVIHAHQRPGDGIAFTRRLDARRALRYELRDVRMPTDVFLRDTPQQRAGYAAGECPDPRPCAVGYRRIWLVSAGQEDDPYSGMAQQKSLFVRERFRTVRSMSFANVKLRLLERVGQPPPTGCRERRGASGCAM